MEQTEDLNDGLDSFNSVIILAKLFFRGIGHFARCQRSSEKQFETKGRKLGQSPHYDSC